MPWEMEVRTGAKVERTGPTLYVDGGTWEKVHPEPMLGCSLPPYRYEEKEDAVQMLDKLYPDLRDELKRVVYV